MFYITANYTQAEYRLKNLASPPGLPQVEGGLVSTACTCAVDSHLARMHVTSNGHVPDKLSIVHDVCEILDFICGIR